MTSNDSNSASFRTVRVDLGARSYDVVIGRGFVIDCFDQFYYGKAGNRGWNQSRLAVIADERLRASYEGYIESMMIHSVVDYLIYWVAPGESAKSLDNHQRILSWLAAEKFTRNDIVMGVGGGVIGDLAGFVAATYLRGIAFVQVPTTLLAMVDSSVGGKTGVNLPEGKNLVGAFHQPRLVVADLDTLATLPAGEFASGMAEVIKYGAIRDRALFDRVANGVTPQDDDLAAIVEKCVAIKARIVEQDEFETKGERALLNFGHTLGHAIEKATGYTRYKHGEAIALGMRAAAWLSVWHPETQLPEADARALEEAILDNDLPLTLDPEVSRDTVLAALGNDKKVAADGGNRWVLLTRLGEARSGFGIEASLVNRAIELLYEEKSAS